MQRFHGPPAIPLPHGPAHGAQEIGEFEFNRLSLFQPERIEQIDQDHLIQGIGMTEFFVVRWRHFLLKPIVCFGVPGKHLEFLFGPLLRLRNSER